MGRFGRTRPGKAHHGSYHRGRQRQHGHEPWCGEPPSVRRFGRARGEGGSAVVEFALVAPLAILTALAVAQFALFLYERNVVMGSMSEGVRVAASTGRSISDGQLAAAKLLRESLGGRIARTVLIRGAVENGLAVLRTDATLPSLVPGMPGLEVHMTAAMHKEDDLGVTVEAQTPLISDSITPVVPLASGATAPAGGRVAADGAGDVAASDGGAVAPDGEGSAPASDVRVWLNGTSTTLERPFHARRGNERISDGARGPLESAVDSGHGTERVADRDREAMGTSRRSSRGAQPALSARGFR
jgi:Flp pilus assembly protein TadG